MKYLFLDMDGVLNSHHWTLWQIRTKERKSERSDDGAEQDRRIMMKDTDPRLLFNLRFITENVPQLGIVISSTWRRSFKLEQFGELFMAHGMRDGLVIGATPDKVDGQNFSERVPRIGSIDAYRKTNGIPWSDVVIIDDHHVGEGHWPKTKWMPEDEAWTQRFVQTCQLDGLTYLDACRVIDLFEGAGGWKQPTILM